jgi:AcrR family transcriptional regulator
VFKFDLLFNGGFCYILNMFKNETPMKKSDHTKERLFQIAMAMISKKGFEATTMRAIAAEAGVAPGATYYYFESKESFVYEYYKQSQDEHEKALDGFFDQELSFSKRLHRAITSKIEAAMPHKNMARALYRNAANPESSLSPFSEESKQIRLQALKIFREVVEGSHDKFNPEIKKLLPECLWLYQMGIILFWIYDESKDSTKTFGLIDKTVPLIESMNQMIQSPLAAPFRKKIISVLKAFAPDLGQEADTSKEQRGSHELR